MKKLLKFIFHRVVLLGLVIVIQLAALMVVILKFQEYFVYLFLCFLFYLECCSSTEYYQ